jgi:hypothetical protein
VLDVTVGVDASNGASDDVQRQIVELLEMHAAAAHVELLARRLMR